MSALLPGHLFCLHPAVREAVKKLLHVQTRRMGQNSTPGNKDPYGANKQRKGSRVKAFPSFPGEMSLPQ